MLGLRTADGVPAAWLTERVGGDRRLTRLVGAWEERGLLVRPAPDRVRLSEAGFLLSDALFAEIL
jgi:coproporphyrinogen III oxidase-like Fe-S oxidoreductase